MSSEPSVEPDEADIRSRKMDDELRSIAAMLRMLDDLDPKARQRVVAYLRARFETT